MKRFLSAFIVLIIILSIVSCGEKYTDTNGDADYTLQTITDYDIINLSTGSSGMTYTEESKILPVSSAEYHSGNFNGVECIYRNYYVGKSDVSIYIGHMNVEKGNFRICVINDGKIIFDIPADAFNETYTFEDLAGDFSVHVAGESAEFKFHIDIY